MKSNPRRAQYSDPYREPNPRRTPYHDPYLEPKPRRTQYSDPYQKSNYRKPNYQVPTFSGTSNPEDYIDWEKDMEQYFEWYGLSDEKKCQFVQLRLTDQARLYWDQVERLNNQIGNLPITTWEAMMLKLRAKYVPPYYW